MVQGLLGEQDVCGDELLLNLKIAGVSHLAPLLLGTHHRE